VDASTRVALVTGAGHGIGAGIAERLAGQGHRLVLVDRDPVTLAETTERIVRAGGTASAVEADVADPAMMTGLVERTGPVEILVNNAGFARDHPLTELGLDDWDAVHDVVLRAAFVLTKAVAPAMKERRWGRIVNISSISALNDDGRVNYVAAKAGLNALTRASALELGPYGITVNAVAPGVILTGMTETGARRRGRTLAEHAKILTETNVLVGRIGHPGDIARAVTFFTDEEADFVTGQVLYVSGSPHG
jgi:3-oxoacyl-[acyl-carrier protein] reductase